MGGRKKIRAADVYKTVTVELQNQLLPSRCIARPPWYDVLNSIPPGESTKITYIEDGLRNTFYKDHPWELARPRVVVELDGKDHQRCDWSKGLQQPGMPLSGESVVQRQLWLMQNEGMSKRQAYDLARWDFYRLRQAQEIEKRVAVEEARCVGAYFGKTKLDVGMILEDREFERWKVWAGEKRAQLEAMDSAETFGEVLEDDDGEPGSGLIDALPKAEASEQDLGS